MFNMFGCVAYMLFFDTEDWLAWSCFGASCVMSAKTVLFVENVVHRFDLLLVSNSSTAYEGCMHFNKQKSS